ncbi:hypothetical protein CPB85DRAFT_523038 [Mucidula mucida]|nr:hypothetical protein CPB85DRAFT_523038 [Mucidula mucida]
MRTVSNLSLQPPWLPSTSEHLTTRSIVISSRNNFETIPLLSSCRLRRTTRRHSMHHSKIHGPVRPLRITGIIRPSGGVRMICVYSGELEEDGSTREVAVKLGDCDELWDEVDIFGKLKSLQGTGIPRLIALFRVKKIKRGYFGCLITERFGDFMQEPLCDLDRSVKAKLMTYLADFHRLGVALKDISSRHVLISAGDVRIGNLEEGVHHHCQREATYDFLEAPIYLKDGEDIGLCYWLKSQADKMSFWEPSDVKIFSHFISKSSLPSDMEIVQALKPTSLFERYKTCDGVSTSHLLRDDSRQTGRWSTAGGLTDEN